MTEFKRQIWFMPAPGGWGPGSYGPFDTEEAAHEWARINIASGTYTATEGYELQTRWVEA